MGINSTEVAYQFGQLGSVYTAASSDPIKPPSDKVFVAVTMLDNTVFDDSRGYSRYASIRRRPVYWYRAASS